MQVSFLLHLHLQQAEEVKAQSKEIKRLSTLLERQKTILEQVQEQQQSSISQAPRVQPTTPWLNELQREAFNILLGTVNARCGSSIEHLSGLSQNILVVGKVYLEDELAEEAMWGSHHPHHVHFAGSQKGGLTSTPLISAVTVGEDNTLLSEQRRARESLMNTTMCPPLIWNADGCTRILQNVWAKDQYIEGWLFCYSQFNILIMAQGHMGPCWRPQFIRKRGHDEVEFLYGDGHGRPANFWRPCATPQKCFSVWQKPSASWLVISMVRPRRRMSLKMCLWMIFR